MANEKKEKDILGTKTQRLQEIVEILDEGTQPIDILINYYEEGMKLAKECREYLNKVEGKIIDITKSLEEY